VERQRGGAEDRLMTFTISTVWDDEVAVWVGCCDDIPAAANALTIDELLAKISAMTLDVLPDNHPDIDSKSVCLQIRMSLQKQ
jgi:hypothetical protein